MNLVKTMSLIFFFVFNFFVGASLTYGQGLPIGDLPDLHSPYTAGIGVTVELWLSASSFGKPGETLVSTSPWKNYER